jgi:ketosteroid isomerase-like protein
MSQTNLDVVRRLLSATEDIPAALECLDPEVEWIPLRAATEGTYRGHAGYERFVEDSLASFESFDPRFELRELPDGRVLAWGTIHVRGRGSGWEMDVPSGGIFVVRGGKITRWQDFGSTEKAVAAIRVEIVRGSLDAFADGGLEAMARYWDPHIEWRAIEGAPDDVGDIQGIAAMRRYCQEWIDMFDDLTLVPLSVREVEDGRVVAEQRAAGRAKISGAETELVYAVVYTVREGKIVRGREYASLELAMEVVGVQA